MNECKIRPGHVNRSAFWSGTCLVRSRLWKLLQAYNRILGIRLVLPQLSGRDKLKSLKDELSAPIEGRESTWSKELRKVSREARKSVSHSLFLFRKLLPPSVPDMGTYMERIVSEPPEVDEDFGIFLDQQIDKMFPMGWDEGFTDQVWRETLNTSSVEDQTCSEDARTKFFSDTGLTGPAAQAEYARRVHSDEDKGEVWAKVKSIYTGGKYRLITIPSSNIHLLAPLHHLMYNHISRYHWLLRGDAKIDQFDVKYRSDGSVKSEGFFRSDGEFFVSGDYESATDNLNNKVMKRVLSRILSRSILPESLKQLAMKSLSPLVYTSERDSAVRLSNGQMMGMYLSFPLLCIINYLTFKYAVPRKVPVKINGDDIVFRATREEYTRWMDMVSSSGLVLSKGKTLIDRTFFTLNSTLFKGKTSSVKLVPFVRSRAWFGIQDADRKSDPSASLVGRFFSAFPGFHGSALRYLRISFLKENAKYILASGRSLTRGLGLPLDEDLLRLSSFWDRECALLEYPSEKPLPMNKTMWTHPPVGYSLVHREEKPLLTRAQKEDLAAAFVQAGWLPPSTGDWYKEEFAGGLRVNPLKFRNCARLMKVTKSYLVREIHARRKKVFRSFSKLVRYSVWVKDEDVPDAVRFVKSDEVLIRRIEEKVDHRFLYGNWLSEYVACSAFEYFSNVVQGAEMFVGLSSALSP